MSQPNSETMREEFARDGVTCVREALGRSELDELEKVFAYTAEHPGPLSQYLYPDSGSKVYTDFFNKAQWPRWRSVYEGTAVPHIVSTAWGCDDIWFFFEQIWWKSGGETRRTPWHQDASYTPIAGHHEAIVWIPLDPVKEENGLEFVRGSHRGPVYARSSFDPTDDTASGGDFGSMPPLPNIEADRDAYDIVSWAMEPGDVLVFSFSALHGGGATVAGGERRTVSLRYFGPDAVFQPQVERQEFGKQTHRKPAAGTFNEDSNPVAEMLGQLSPGAHYCDGPWPKLAR